ncbi:bacillithiol system protein YtxJ [Salegentibacter holothuriorum]|uniref:Bacillithiol system protein YtxJ n=1 Tax=Salegentibacter holothuriorum TaxID=241145 RepID=A0A1T5D871_9FLAO|nr:bacillithiol system redox-active protein YtxJ [Salegentibacter holothuriorum]SKB67743.1 bacillithiol system protein YtxJ [Salegentibacter holothuriorum]
MGLLDKLFKGDGDETKEKSSFPWTDLTDKDQITIAKEESKEKLIGIFKHSTRCGISKMVLRNFEKQYEEEENVKLYFLDLVKHREVSNAVANELSVQHESPQFIVLSDEKVVHHASHQDIDAEKLKELS